MHAHDCTIETLAPPLIKKKTMQITKGVIDTGAGLDADDVYGGQDALSTS